MQSLWAVRPPHREGGDRPRTLQGFTNCPRLCSSVAGVPWLAEQLLEAPALLIGSSAEFVRLAATLAQKHVEKTASMEDEFWSAHKEGRHKFLSGGASCSRNASRFTPE